MVLVDWFFFFSQEKFQHWQKLHCLALCPAVESWWSTCTSPPQVHLNICWASTFSLDKKTNSGKKCMIFLSHKIQCGSLITHIVIQSVKFFPAWACGEPWEETKMSCSPPQSLTPSLLPFTLSLYFWPVLWPFVCGLLYVAWLTLPHGNS